MPQQNTVDSTLILWAILASGCVLAAFGLWRAVRSLLRRWREGRQSRSQDRPQQLAWREALPPAAEGAKLFVRNIPMRLVVLVVAPVGRGSSPPSVGRIDPLVAQIVPGLAEVVRTHGTRITLWPPQLSTQGFSHALYAEFPLPGNHGRGTPWCAMSGRFTADGQAFLAGMVLRAAGPNSLAQTTLGDEGEWLQVLRCEA